MSHLRKEPGCITSGWGGNESQTVYYHLVNAMLLNEVQKQQKRIESQDKDLSAMKDQVSALGEQNKEQGQRISALEEQNKEMAALVEKGLEPDARLSKLEDRLIE